MPGTAPCLQDKQETLEVFGMELVLALSGGAIARWWGMLGGSRVHCNERFGMALPEGPEGSRLWRAAGEEWNATGLELENSRSDRSRKKQSVASCILQSTRYKILQRLSP